MLEVVKIVTAACYPNGLHELANGCTCIRKEDGGVIILWPFLDEMNTRQPRMV